MVPALVLHPSCAHSRRHAADMVPAHVLHPSRARSRHHAADMVPVLVLHPQPPTWPPTPCARTPPTSVQGDFTGRVYGQVFDISAAEAAAANPAPSAQASAFVSGLVCWGAGWGRGRASGGGPVHCLLRPPCTRDWHRPILAPPLHRGRKGRREPVCPPPPTPPTKPPCVRLARADHELHGRQRVQLPEVGVTRGVAGQRRGEEGPARAPAHDGARVWPPPFGWHHGQGA